MECVGHQGSKKTHDIGSGIPLAKRSYWQAKNTILLNPFAFPKVGCKLNYITSSPSMEVAFDGNYLGVKIVKKKTCHQGTVKGRFACHSIFVWRQFEWDISARKMLSINTKKTTPFHLTETGIDIEPPRGGFMSLSLQQWTTKLS